jgi:excinuclease ABC subunit B
VAIIKNKKPFELTSKYKPEGDQPKAIEHLVKGLKEGKKHQTLLGATGTGKTFTMANIINQVQKPTLVLAHNKTLAAQLCNEFQEFFPNNAVSYFVSYYDYYQPEAYMPASDTYIEKEATINDEINRHRHAATFNLLTRNDVIIVSSVSCIYGLGNVSDYEELAISLSVGEVIKRNDLLKHLSEIQFSRVTTDFKPGMFNVMGDTVEIYPSAEDHAYRIEFWGDDIEGITKIDPFTGEVFEGLDSINIFPAKHTVTKKERIEEGIDKIKEDLEKRVQEYTEEGRILEAERIKTRTEYDIEMMLETGYSNGIENYTRYFSGLPAGTPPSTLIDFFPDDFLTFVDESHITIPQIGAMHNGNLSRKNTLIAHGFRLPSAHDNRPLKFEEFEKKLAQSIYVSATPGKYEHEKCPREEFAEQVIRPTGLLDPIISVRPSEARFWNESVHTIKKDEANNQIDDLCLEVSDRIKKNQRVLVTTATKKMAEKVSAYFEEIGINSKYLHSEIETFERIETIQFLREGKIDVIVGVNLLREGLDIPEVSLVAILDADKRGFLRSRDALIQTIGRAARNAEGVVILYGDVITPAMDEAMSETKRRRTIQEAHNKKHGITPKTILKNLSSLSAGQKHEKKIPESKKNNIKEWIRELEQKLELAVENLEFEKAADLRDEIEVLKNA